MMSTVKRTTVLAILFGLIIASSAFAGWTIPIKISDNGAYMPRIAFANGALHTLYYDCFDNVSYVRSTDLGQSWSTPVEMTEGYSNYPELKASGDLVIACWKSDLYPSVSRYNYGIRKSTDGGANWDNPGYVLSGNQSDIYDFNFCFSGERIFFIYTYCYLGCDVFFQKSTDLGTSWSDRDLLGIFTSIDIIEMESFGNNVFLVIGGVLNYREAAEVYFLRSSDGGEHWSRPESISMGDSTTSYKPHMAVNELGELAVCWAAEAGAYNTDILLRLSHDFGQSWDQLIVNAGIKGWADDDISYEGDTLHLVSGGGTYIRHTVSTDEGLTWAQIDTVEENRYQSYDPVIAVSPGMYHVVWDDRRVHWPGIDYARWEAGYTPPDSSLPGLNIVGTCGVHPSSFYNTISVDGNYAYAGGGSFYDTNIEIVDIGNPTNPQVVSTFDTAYIASNMTASGDFLYISGLDSGGMVIYDVSNPLDPILASFTSNYALSWDLCKRDTLVYFSGGGMIQIFDVANPFEPAAIGVYNPARYAYLAIDVEGDYLYGLNHQGLDVIDVSDPSSPSLRGHYDNGGIDEGCDIAVAGNYVYISNHRAEIVIVDISNPASPTYSGTYLLDYGSVNNLVVDDNYLLVAHSDLSVFDVSDPGNPVILATYEGPMRFYAVAAEGEYVYARSIDTFAVFELPVVNVYDDNCPDLPQNHLLLQNYPNPFNAQTTISYSLPQAGPVTLYIYNVMGQKVATLVAGLQSAGEHNIVWDAGADTPSGIYFYKLETSGLSKCQKMILVR